jgi:hypothetical protein
MEPDQSLIALAGRSVKHALAGLAALAAALFADGSRAGTHPAGLAEVFIRFCGETGGDADRALQLADTAQWSAPRSDLTLPSFGAEWIRRQGRWTQAQGVRRVLVVGTIRDPDGHARLSCSVAEVIPPGMTVDVAVVRKGLQDWVGAAPVRTRDAYAEFAYRDPGRSDVARVTLNYLAAPVNTLLLMYSRPL